MADAHIPNRVATPDWIEPRHKLIPFATALETTLAPGTENEFDGKLSQDWCGPGEDFRIEKFVRILNLIGFLQRRRDGLRMGATAAR